MHQLPLGANVIANSQGWGAPLLSYLDQQPLQNSYNFNTPSISYLFSSLVGDSLKSTSFPTFIIIDGLDEFQEDNRTHADLLRTLKQISHSQDIKLCVS